VLNTAAGAIDAVVPIAGADDSQHARSQVHALLNGAVTVPVSVWNNVQKSATYFVDVHCR
jgi:hypothetical protein